MKEYVEVQRHKTAYVYVYACVRVCVCVCVCVCVRNAGILRYSWHILYMNEPCCLP